MKFPDCSTVAPFLRYPEVCCHEHGRQPSGYWLCRHIREGSAVSLRIPATKDLTGILLCGHCANADGRTIASDVRLICTVCAHEALLTDSMELRS